MHIPLVIVELSELVGNEELSPSVCARVAFVSLLWDFVVNHIDVSRNLIPDMQYNGDLPKNQSHHKNCVGNAVKTFRAMSELWENQGGDHLCLVAKENVCGSTKESPEKIFSE